MVFDLNPGSLKNKAVFLPGEAAVLRSAVSAQQPAELALLAGPLPVLPTCNKGKDKFKVFSFSNHNSNHNTSLLRQQLRADATRNQPATKEDQS